MIDLGMVQSRQWMTNYVSDAISAWEIDTFRIESSCNGGHDCVSYFKSHDRVAQARMYPGVARAGVTEIAHTRGFHTMLDELRLRHKTLVIDVCAGGGRKIDLDIMGRSIQKWQSDHTCDPTSDQGHLMGEQHYQPLSAGGVGSSEPYSWRSVATTGALIFWDQTRDDAASRARTAAAIAETKRLRPLLVHGNFYQLSNLDRYGFSNFNSAQSTWAAWQFANSTAHNGAALFFRRTKAPLSIQVALQEVESPLLATQQTYQLRFYYNYSLDRTEVCHRDQLLNLTIRLPYTTPARQESLLVEYELL